MKVKFEGFMVVLTPFLAVWKKILSGLGIILAKEWEFFVNGSWICSEGK